LKSGSHIFLFLFASCVYSIALSQSITFEKYYDTLGCFGGACVQQTYDNGYIISGVNSISTLDNNVALIKTDSIGKILWFKSYGGNNADGGEYIEQTPDSGFIIVGEKDYMTTTDSKIWLLKTDKNGDTLWTKTIGAPGANIPYSVRQTTDGGYVICGYTSA
jgi:hypothetical protein